MPVLYKARQASIANKEGKKLFHPQVVTTGTVTLDQLAKEVAELSSLSTGDVKNSIDNLIVVMTRHLHSSESVLLDGLGSFALSLRSTGKGVETADEVTAQNSRVKTTFRPTSTRNSDRTVATRSLITGASFVKLDAGTTTSSSTDDSTTDDGSTEEDDENLYG
ncbi:MAG: HU family DNA-binding protein [Bacteroides sp.]|nr:HU family DNA-binding protein [Bacteroides sp.]